MLLYCSVGQRSNKWTASSFITVVLVGSFASARYTVDIPKDAIWVTNWDQLHEMAAKYPDAVLVSQYGGKSQRLRKSERWIFLDLTASAVTLDAFTLLFV